MRVNIDNDGVSAHSFNDKARISHEVVQKINLAKRIDGTLSNRVTRTVGNTSGVENSPRGSPPHGSVRLASEKQYKVPSNDKQTKKNVINGKKAVHIAGKPVESLKRQFYSRADKSDDNGVKAAKTGVQIGEKTVSGVKTAVNVGVKTAENGAKLTKRVYRKLQKTTSTDFRRRLRKQITRQNLGEQASHLAKRAAENTAKATERATKKAAQAAVRAAQAAARAVVNAVTRIVGFIVETMPYSLVIIAGAALILSFSLMFGSAVSGAGGTVAGGGAWVVEDNDTQTVDDIYDGYKIYVEQAESVIKAKVKDELKSKVSDFCDDDTEEAQKIIQYMDKNNNRTIYPAAGADSTINALIDQFGADEYADFISVLFVLMTREKQQEDDAEDDEGYNFKFSKSDFEEFVKSVNVNSCRWGDTFVYKTAVETSSQTCPDENCEDNICPGNHTKLTVKLYTVKDYYGKDYPEIYNFTENEIARYEASKEIIEGLMDYEEE